MPYLKNDTDLSIYYEDHGNDQSILLIHGWPLSGAMWEYQVSFLIENDYRVITYDRRGFGRSSRPWNGYDYKTMASDLNNLINHLELEDIILIGFSMGGGELAQYVDSYGTDKLDKLIFLSSVVPYLLHQEDNPDGAPNSVFQEMEHNIKTNRAGFLKGFGAFFMDLQNNLDRVSQAQIDYNFQIAMDASPKATLDCINAFGRTDFRKAIEKIDIPTLFIHGGKDDIVPIQPSSHQGHSIVKNSELKVVKDAPHGLYVTHKDEVNDIILSFVKS